MKKPYPFQVQAVRQALEAPGFLIADECGLGKTITAIEIIKAARTKYGSTGPWRSLVVCPPSLILQWTDTIEDQDPDRTIVVPGRVPYNYTSVDGYVVMTYYDFLHAPTRAGLGGLIWDCMILDEAHRIKNRKAKTTVYIKQIQAARKVALTGTPMEKSPTDLWSILNFFDPYEFPAYWAWVMENLYVTAGYFEQFVVGAPKHPEAFGNILKPYMIRRTKEEVAPALPEKILIEEHVAMTEKQQAIYDQLKKSTDIEVQVEDKTLLIQNVLALITKLQQVSSFPPLLGLSADSGKMNWLKDFLDDHKGEPTVIFTRFRNSAIHLADTLGCGLIIGGERREVGDTGLLVGTIDAMGEGLNLQWAKHAIFIDSHWSTIKMTQAIDRIHRIDIKEPKNIYLLWSTKEDRLVLDALDHKWSESEMVYYYLNQPVEVPNNQAD